MEGVTFSVFMSAVPGNRHARQHMELLKACFKISRKRIEDIMFLVLPIQSKYMN